MEYFIKEAAWGKNGDANDEGKNKLENAEGAFSTYSAVTI
jgi:hypothetical protein